MTVSEIKKYLISQLTPVVGATETEAMTRVMILQDLGLSPVDTVLNGQRQIENFTERRLKEQCARVVAGEPLQYVLGQASFHGLELKVNPAVLIPRPETSQLVDIITDRAEGASDLNVVDLCTGSGCIILALGRSLNFPHLTAVDNSPAALQVAEENARMLHIDVKFVETDVLSLEPPTTPYYDIIVSNPPYVAESEKKDMDPRVLDHEPASALFVPDNDPLKFYKAISRYALKALKQNGTLYFEINPLFATDLQDMLENDGWGNVQILRDFRGKNRFAVCQH